MDAGIYLSIQKWIQECVFTFWILEAKQNESLRKLSLKLNIISADHYRAFDVTARISFIQGIHGPLWETRRTTWYLTAAYSPTERYVRKKNITLIYRAKATLCVAKITFTNYWSLWILNTVTKAKTCYRVTNMNFRLTWPYPAQTSDIVKWTLVARSYSTYAWLITSIVMYHTLIRGKDSHDVYWTSNFTALWFSLGAYKSKTTHPVNISSRVESQHFILCEAVAAQSHQPRTQRDTSRVIHAPPPRRSNIAGSTLDRQHIHTIMPPKCTLQATEDIEVDIWRNLFVKGQETHDKISKINYIDADTVL